MTNQSHMGGTLGDLESANYVYNTWTSQKLDYIKKLIMKYICRFQVQIDQTGNVSSIRLHYITVSLYIMLLP